MDEVLGVTALAHASAVRTVSASGQSAAALVPVAGPYTPPLSDQPETFLVTELLEPPNVSHKRCLR